MDITDLKEMVIEMATSAIANMIHSKLQQALIEKLPEDTVAGPRATYTMANDRSGSSDNGAVYMVNPSTAVFSDDHGGVYLVAFELADDEDIPSTIDDRDELARIIDTMDAMVFTPDQAATIGEQLADCAVAEEL
ncbi:MAG: hypothetical protein ABEI86_08460 [Halobacteriaceae archaeon]